MQPPHPGFDPRMQPPQPGFGSTPTPAPKRNRALLWSILAGCTVLLLILTVGGLAVYNSSDSSLSREDEVRAAVSELVTVFADAAEGNPDTWIPYTTHHVCTSHQAFFANAGNWILAESGDAEALQSARDMRAIAEDPSDVAVRFEGDDKAFALLPSGHSTMSSSDQELYFLHEDGEWKFCDD